MTMVAEYNQAAFKMATVGMAVIAADGRLLQVNDALCRYLAKSEEELLGKQYTGFISPKEAELWQNNFDRLLRQEITSFDLQQGDSVRAVARFSAVSDVSGPPSFVVGQIIALPCVDVPSSSGWLCNDSCDNVHGSQHHQVSLLSFALNQVQDAAFLIDRHGNFGYVNDKACLSLGYTREELLGMGVPDIDPGWQRERCEKAWPDLQARGSNRIETYHLTRNGKLAPVEVVANYFEYEGVGYNLALARDISLRREHEKILREHSELEQRLSHFSASAPGFMYTCRLRPDGSFHFPFASPGVERIFGVKPEDIAQSSAILDSRFHAEDRARLYTVTYESASTLAEFHVEFRVDHPVDGLIWVEARSAVESSPDGSIQWHGFMYDITDRKRMEERLRTSESRFRTLAENLPDHIIRFDEAGRSLYVNPSAGKDFDLSASSSCSTSLGGIDERPTPANNDPCAKALRQTFEQGLPFAVETSRKTRDGKRLFEVRHIPEWSQEGRVTSVLRVARDVTALKEAERRLRELSARRESIQEEERKRIAREVHDELGQHLTALRLGISTLRFEFGVGDHLLLERVQALMAMTDKTIQVVRDVATMLRPPEFDMGLPAALQWLVDEFIQHTGIPCRLQMPKGKLAVSEERATEICRVLQESLTNVAKHAEATSVEVVLERGDRTLLLTISDNGKGFDAEESKRNAFGLLSMSERALVLGGKLEITGRPERGTIVRLHAPINAPGELQ